MTTPTTKSIETNILAQLQAALNKSTSLLSRAFNRVLAKTLSAVFIILYKYAGQVHLNQFVATASSRDTTILGVLVNPLKFWGRLIGVGDPTEAIPAELVVTVTVNIQTGSIPVNTPLTADNGVTYLTTTGTVLDAATVDINVLASDDAADNGGAGAVGNLIDGSTLTFVTTPENTAPTGVVASTVTAGADAEDLEVYRGRIIERFQKRPQGGAYADYEQWVEGVEGIINAYPYTGSPGQVDIYVEATATSSGNADGIPTTAQLEACLEAVNNDVSERATRRNTNAWPNLYPITRKAFTVSISNIAGVSNLAQVQTDCTKAVQDYFLGVEPFIPGLTLPPRKDQVTKTKISAVVEEIVTLAGGTFDGISFIQTGSSGGLNAYALLEGEKVKATVVYT